MPKAFHTGLEALIKTANASTWLGAVPGLGPALSFMAAGYGDDSARSGIATGLGSGLGQMGGSIVGGGLADMLARSGVLPDDVGSMDSRSLGALLGSSVGGSVGARLGHNIAGESKKQPQSLVADSEPLAPEKTAFPQWAEGAVEGAEQMGRRSFTAHPSMTGMGQLAARDVARKPMGALGRYGLPAALAGGAGLTYAGMRGYDKDQGYRNLVSAPGMGGAY